MGSAVSALPTDVTFPVDSFGQANEVKVDVFRTIESHQSSEDADWTAVRRPDDRHRATATAQAAPAGGMTCVKPFIIPDKWIENTNPPWNMNTSVYDHYDNRGNVLTPHDDYDPTMGYSMMDKGTVLILRAGSGNNIQPTFYFSWSMPGNPPAR